MRLRLHRRPAAAPEDRARLPRARVHAASACARLWETRDAAARRDLWKKLAEVGLAGRCSCRRRTAAWASTRRSLVLLLEECGRAALAEPVVETAAVGRAAARRARRRGARRALAPARRGGRGDRSRSAIRDDAFVAGRARRRPAAAAATREGDLHAVPRGAAKLTAQPANDPSRGSSRSTFARRAGDPRRAAARAPRELLAAAFDRGALACAAQLLGVARPADRDGGRLRVAARAVRASRSAPSRR